MNLTNDMIVKMTNNDIINLQMFLSRVDIKGKEAFVLCSIIKKLEEAQPSDEV